MNKEINDVIGVLQRYQHLNEEYSTSSRLLKFMFLLGYLDTRGCLDETCSHCQDGWYRVRIRRDFHCRQKCPTGYFEIRREGKPKLCGRKY